MFKSRSMFQKVIYKTLLIACIPLVIITLLFCSFVYKRNVEKVFNETEAVMQEYVHSIQREIENTLQRSDYLLRTAGVTERLDIKYEKNIDRLILSNYLSEYIGLYAAVNSEMSFTIYTSNESLYEDRVVARIEKLFNYDDIWETLEKSPTNLVWEKKIGHGIDSSFTFYRKFMTEGKNILACRVHIPDAPKDYKMRICLLGEAESPNQQIQMPINETFALCTERNNQIAYYEVLKTVSVFVTFFAFSLIIIFVLSKRITRGITQSVDTFVRKLGRENILEMDEMDFYQETDLEEMQIIKRAILHLLTENKKISDSKQRIELEKKDMELGLLQTQLDPHTLYNSLSAIKYNAFAKGDTDTINIVNHMTEYYRAVLNKGKDFMRLDEELEAMRKYVAINELSRGIHYELVITREPELANCKIIHLLLLPFIENAIIHGFDGDEDRCVINIKCTHEEDFIVIQIADNGFGIEKEQLMRMNDLEHYHESYGVKNSYRRLKLAYGDESHIAYQSEPGKGTTVTLRFLYEF